MQKKKNRRNQTPEEIVNPRVLKQRRIRRVRRIRAVWTLILLAAAAAAGILIYRARTKPGETDPETIVVQKQEKDLKLQEQERVLLSFPRLLVSKADASSGNDDADTMTVDEFRLILQQLDARGYVLVSPYDILKKDKEGKWEERAVSLPDGKKPLLIAARNVCYSERGSGYAVSLEQDSKGNFRNQAYDDTGEKVSGSYDLITVLDDYVKKHPDFSCNGAKGILGITGINGVLGYGTSSSDQTKAKALADALRKDGWILAGNTYAGISCGAETELLKEDAKKWTDSVLPVLGSADILLMPGCADIDIRKPYSKDNEKFSFLSQDGFRIFCAGSETRDQWSQTGDGFARLVFYEAHSMESLQKEYLTE